MTPLLLAASMLGQYGGYGATVNHCVGTGYCGYHQVYHHQQAVFSADPYYLTQAVAGYIRQQAADAARAQAERDLNTRLDRIEQALKAQQAPAPASLTDTLGPPPGSPAVPPPPTPEEVAAAPLTTALKRCATCHTAGTDAGGVRIFDTPDRLTSLDLAAKTQIHEAVKAGRMPPKGPKLTAAEREPIAASIQEDLKNIADTLKD